MKLPLDGFWWNLKFKTFSKTCPENASFIKITRTVHEDVFTFTTVSHTFLPGMRNISNKSCREKNILCSVTFSENRVVYETISKNIVEPERSQTVWRLCVAYWISKASRASTNSHRCTQTHRHTHSHALVHAFLRACAHTEMCNTYCFPRQQLFRERSLMLRYTYIACIVVNV